MFYIFAKIEIIFKQQKNKDITILLYLCYKTYYFTFQSLVASAMRYFSIMTLLYILTNIEHFYPKRLIKDTSLQVFTYKKLYLKDYIFLKDKKNSNNTRLQAITTPNPPRIQGRSLPTLPSKE